MTAASQFLHAYSATHYVVESPEGPIVTTIGTPVRFKGVPLKSAHLITAYNPKSVLTEDAVNENAHRALCEWVKAAGLTAWPTKAIDPEGQWPVEPGLLIWGLSDPKALTLAQHFGQNAWVAFHLEEEDPTNSKAKAPCWIPSLQWVETP